MSRDRRLITLSTLSGLLAQCVRPEDILPTAVETVVNVMRVEVVLIYSLEGESRELVLSSYRGVPSEFAQGVDRMKLGEGFNGWVAETGEAMLVADAAQDPRLSREVVRQEKLRAQLVVPMKSRGAVVGTICVATRRRREFDAGDVELLTAIGNQIGIAIDQARLYQLQLSLTELLRRSEANYRELFHNASDAILIHDMEGNIIEANKACEKLLGYPADELLGRRVSEFLRGEAIELARGLRGRLLDGERIEQRYEQHIARADGTEAIIEVATRLMISDGKPVGFHHIGRDVTDERKMRDSLHFYLRQVLRAQEEERKRISRELHDDSAQSLLVLIRQLDTIASDPKSRLSRSVEKKLAEAHDLAVETLDGLRRYAQELRPAILDDMGLVAALKWMADELARERIEVVAELDMSGRDLPHETELVLFRIAQEALTNVARHAEASKVVIRLEPGPKSVRVVITDNGKGFKVPVRLSDVGASGKLGLIGMQERARLLGGTLSIQSELGKGTTVCIEVPVEA